MVWCDVMVLWYSVMVWCVVMVWYGVPIAVYLILFRVTAITDRNFPPDKSVNCCTVGD